MMRNKVKNFLWFLIENLPSFLTIVFAGYVLVRSQAPPPLEVIEILLWLLAITGLLATSELVERLRRLKRIEDRLEALQALLIPDTESFLCGYKERQRLDDAETAKHASQIWVSGYSLTTLVREHETFLKERLEDGCSIRLLLLKPDSEAARTLNHLVTPRPGELISDIKNTLARLDRISNSVQSSKAGKLEVRLLKIVPNFSLVIIDPDLSKGWVQVELYPSYQGVPLDTGRPHFTLREKSGHWYRFFYNQFQQLWIDSRYSESNRAS